MLWLKGKLFFLKTINKKWPVIEPLQFEPSSVQSWANLPFCIPKGKNGGHIIGMFYVGHFSI
jgi:hypothetical protein